MSVQPAQKKAPAKFFGELKARNVRKTLAIYLSAALTAIGMVNIFSLRYQLPQGLFDGMLIFLLFGFFNAAVFGWFRGRTDGKPTRTKELILHGLILAAAGVAIAYVVSTPRTAFLPRNAKIIAVLPFKNMSENAENAYFSDGIMEDILTQLSKIEDLKVISRTSVMQYRDTEKTVREIGKELGAGSILEGSVRYSGDSVRIVGQLINAQTDEHLWGETYDRALRNIFAIQSDVAQKIAESLQATLSPAEKQLIERKPTENIEAYGYYLRGRELYYNYSNDDNERAVTMFRRAIALDSAYALAYAGLADAYGQRVQRFGFDPSWTDSAIVLCNRAIEIDPEIAEPYKALGLAYGSKEWYTRALQQYSIAIQKNPNLSDGVDNKGVMYLWKGDPERALPFIQKSIILTPGRGSTLYHLASVYEALELDSLAELHMWKVLELHPDFIFVYRDLSRVLYARGRKKEAVTLMDSIGTYNQNDPMIVLGRADLQLYQGNLRKARELYSKALDLLSIDAGPTTQLAYIRMKEGDVNGANEFLEKSIEVSMREIANESENYEYPYDLAKVYAIRGDTAQSIDWFRKAIDAGWIFPRYTEMDPQLESIRETAGYREAMEGLRVKVASARKRLEEKGLIPGSAVSAKEKGA